MNGSVAAVVNPSSGHHFGARIVPWLRLRLGERLEMLMVEDGVDVAAWVRTQATSGCERVLVFGGDGTFREVAAGLLASETPVGLVAVGTNNNIAATLGLPTDPHEAAEVALSGEAQWVSAGRIGDYVFFEGAGVGLEADLWPVGEALIRHRFREVLAAPVQLARDRGVRVRIDLEAGERRLEVRALTLTISNTAMTGAHLKLCPGIDIRDPALYLTVYHDMGRLKMLAALPSWQRGRQGHGYRAERHSFMLASIDADEPMHVHADGTLIGSVPISVQAIPKAVKVAFPPDSSMAVWQ